MEGDTPLMIATVYVDESYGDTSRLLVGGLLSSWHKWLGFTLAWNSLLDRAEVPYAHYLEMDRNKGPYADRTVWNRGRKSAFLQVQYDLMRDWCQMGLTVSIDTQLYNDVYRANFPKGHSPDSAYGIASKELIVNAQRHANEYFSDVESLNFVWERGHQNLPNVQQIFFEMKDSLGDKAKSLGNFIPLSRTEAVALQLIDQLAVAARRTESQAKKKKLFADVPQGADLATVEGLLAPSETFPIFYHELTEERLLWHREHKVEMNQLIRQARRNR